MGPYLSNALFVFLRTFSRNLIDKRNAEVLNRHLSVNF